MTAPYEAEVRVRVPRIEELRAKLQALGAQPTVTYAFTDHYYQPRGYRWPPQRQSLRVREFPSGHAEVLYTRIALVDEGGLSFKRSLLPQGKAVLARGTPSECRALLDDLGFLPWLRVRKLSGELIEIPGTGTIACEEIEGHGWWLEAEVEGASPSEASQRLKARLLALGIDPRDVSPLPVAALVAPPAERRVYFCGAIRGGRRLQARYARFVGALEAAGWAVLTAHVASPDVQAVDQKATSPEILRRDMEWLGEADVVVAEATVPSLGVGIEIATALARGVPVVALVQDGTALSALVEGDQRIHLIRYQTEGGAVASLLAALETLTS